MEDATSVIVVVEVVSCSIATDISIKVVELPSSTTDVAVDAIEAVTAVVGGSHDFGRMSGNNGVSITHVSGSDAVELDDSEAVDEEEWNDLLLVLLVVETMAAACVVEEVLDPPRVEVETNNDLRASNLFIIFLSERSNRFNTDHRRLDDASVCCAAVVVADEEVSLMDMASKYLSPSIHSFSVPNAAPPP